MGVRQRVVRQTITEVVCDLCKKPVDEDKAQVGTLSVKPAGARGRPRQLDVAFHTDCYKKLADSAAKGRGAAKKRGGPKKRAGAKKRGGAKKARSGAKGRGPARKTGGSAKKAAKRPARGGGRKKAQV